MQSTATGRTWIVYTQGGGPDYNEIPTGGNVNIVGSTRFLSSNTGIPLPPIAGGMTFGTTPGTGGGPMPVLNGGFGGVNDTFPINFVQIQGYAINGGRTQPVMDAYLSADGGVGEGIFLEHVPFVLITDNVLNGLGGGVRVAASPLSSSPEAPEGNSMSDSNGIEIVSDGDFTATIVNNISSNWGMSGFDDFVESPESIYYDTAGSGIVIAPTGPVTVNLTLTSNTTDNNSVDGIRFLSYDGGLLNAHIVGNQANDNGERGLNIDADATKTDGLISGNTLNGNWTYGFVLVSGPGSTAGVSSNTMMNNAHYGFDSSLRSGSNIPFTGNMMSGNNGGGPEFILDFKNEASTITLDMNSSLNLGKFYNYQFLNDSAATVIDLGNNIGAVQTAP